MEKNWSWRLWHNYNIGNDDDYDESEGSRCRAGSSLIIWHLKPFPRLHWNCAMQYIECKSIKQCNATALKLCNATLRNSALAKCSAMQYIVGECSADHWRHCLELQLWNPESELQLWNPESGSQLMESALESRVYTTALESRVWIPISGISSGIQNLNYSSGIQSLDPNSRFDFSVP